MVCTKDKNLNLDNNKILIHDVCIIQSEKIDQCVEENVYIFEKKSFQIEANNNISNRIFDEPRYNLMMITKTIIKIQKKYDESNFEEPFCSSGSEYIPDATDYKSGEYEKSEDFYETQKLEQNINMQSLRLRLVYYSK